MTGLQLVDSPSEVQPPQKGTPGDQTQVQAKRAVVVIGQAWMRTIRVQHLEQPVDVALALRSPLIPIFREETPIRQ